VASSFLPANHWAQDALRRLDGLGVLPRGFDVGIQTRATDEVAALFVDARDSALALHRPHIATLANTFLQRLAEEYPGDVAPVASATPAASRPLGHGLVLTRAAIAGGYRRSTGLLAIGTAYATAPVPDTLTAAGTADLAVRLGSHLAASVTADLRSGGAELDAAYAVADLGSLALWAGRRSVGFGPGEDGGIVLSQTTFTGAGLVLVRPWLGPGPLRHLGPISFESFLSRIRNGDPTVGYGITDPLIWGNHLSVSPARGLVIGATRVFLMGGRNNDPARLSYFLNMLIGRYDKWHAETASVDARWRTPLKLLPLVAYIEWGMETASGAFLNVPARVIGVEIAAVPTVPWLGVGIERTGFHPGCCGTGAWYGNWQFEGNWADAGQPLGHPLGGTGHEYALHLSADPFAARLRLRAVAFTRNRGQDNLYAASRQGTSRGGWIRADLRLARHVGLEAEGYLERGSGWDEARVAALLRLHS
jgi:Capsule assembly protein Wzi